jgi:soluble lytic murein transglycosylase
MDPTLALSLRHMKVFTPEYLTLDYDKASKEVWGYLFPLPLQEAVMRSAKAQNLDPYLVAGLIRQESEFNPTVVSRAHAFGWMQLLPSTGSMMAKKAGMAPFQTRMLLDPEVSLRLGTTYLRTQLDKWNGSLEQTLAAYNAGPGRVQQWIAGRVFREPAEFVESIPFNETRDYVQSVIRNALVYRQLYGVKSPPPQPANALTSTHVDAPRAATAALKPKRTIARKRAG